MKFTFIKIIKKKLALRRDNIDNPYIKKGIVPTYVHGSSRCIVISKNGTKIL